jgi:hypothetical protein
MRGRENSNCTIACLFGGNKHCTFTTTIGLRDSGPCCYVKKRPLPAALRKEAKEETSGKVNAGDCLALREQ